MAVSINPMIPGFKRAPFCLPSSSSPYIAGLNSVPASPPGTMEPKNEESLWPYWTGAWPDSHLLEEEALLSGLSLPSLHFHPSCSTITSTNILQGELDAIFEDDVLRHWDDMELQSGNKVEEEAGNERLPLLCYTEEEKEAVSSNTKVVVTAAGQQAVRSSEEQVLTFELVSQYFYMPIMQAARELNVGLTLLKKRCRELGIPRWPHRKMKSLQSLIKNVQVLQEAGKATDEEQLRALVEMLQQEKQLLEQRPYEQLDEKTKRLRQACFKANYKKKRLLALKGEEAPRWSKQ